MIQAVIYTFNLHSVIVLQLLEENIYTFMKNELRRIQRGLNPDYPESLEGQSEDVLVGGDEEQRSSREAFLEITVNFLRRMKQDELAKCIRNSKNFFRFNMMARGREGSHFLICFTLMFISSVFIIKSFLFKVKI